MKKWFAILLMFLYIIPAIGVNVSAHFCIGKPVTELCSKEQKSCFCGSKSMKKNCCENKQQFLKIDDTQQKAELVAQKFSNPFYAVINIPVKLAPLAIAKSVLFIGNVLPMPPNLCRQPIYLLNRVFRI